MPMISKAVCQELQLAARDGPTVRLREVRDVTLEGKVHRVLARSVPPGAIASGPTFSPTSTPTARRPR